MNRRALPGPGVGYKRASTFLPSKNPTIGIVAIVKTADGDRINPARKAS